MFHRDPLIAAEYLKFVLADGDETDPMLALRSLSKAFGDGQKIARQAEANAHTFSRNCPIRETLH